MCFALTAIFEPTFFINNFFGNVGSNLARQATFCGVKYHTHFLNEKCSYSTIT